MNIILGIVLLFIGGMMGGYASSLEDKNKYVSSVFMFLYAIMVSFVGATVLLG